MEDMEKTGGRHPGYAKWKVGVSKDGKFQVLDYKFYLNGGYSEDVSSKVLERAFLTVGNVYK